MNPGKVIGYFASKRGAGQFCDKTALIITGSESTMRKAMVIRGVDPGGMMIQKTRMGEILNGMSAGGAYAFDAEAYHRFAPEAETAGIPRTDFDFTPSAPGLIKFLILEPRSKAEH